MSKVIGIVVVLVVAGAGAAYLARGDSGTPAPVGPRTVASELGPVRVVLRETGVIRPYREVVVTSVVSGRLVRLAAREGARVEAGQVVARIEPDLNQAQLVSQVRSAHDAARLRLQVAETEYERAERLFERELITEQELADRRSERDASSIQFTAAREQLRLMQESGVLAGADAGILNVVSPASGIVIGRGVEEGEAVQAGTGVFGGGTPIITVAELDRLKIESEINEIDIGKIDVGRAVRITVDAYPEAEFEGSIVHISPAARNRDGVRVFDVEVEVWGSDARLRPGMTANLDIEGASRDEVVTVPIEAVFRRDGRDVVYRITGNGVEAVPVVLGLADTERVEIVSGLEAGVQVAGEDPAIAAERARVP